MSENIKDTLKSLSTAQLREMQKILTVGVAAYSAVDRAYLCHKSPPKGYPEDKSEYGDPACYRYPLNTKQRCISAWRYVHQERNRRILGKKFSSVASKIKKYAKEHYDLDLQAEAGLDWEEEFSILYDMFTGGERAEDVEYSETNSNEVNKVDEKEIAELQNRITSLTDELKEVKETLTSKEEELSQKSSEIETITQERDELSQFKADVEKERANAQRLSDLKEKAKEAGVEIDMDAEADKWIQMDDSVFDFVLAKMVENKSKAEATASKSDKTDIPPIISSSDEDEDDTKSKARKYLLSKEK